MGKLKKFAALTVGVCVSISAIFSVAGCNVNKPDNSGDKPPAENPEEPVDELKDVKNFVIKIKGRKFSYQSQDSAKITVDGNNVKVAGNVDSYYVKDVAVNKKYSIKYDVQDQSWHKNLYEVVSEEDVLVGVDSFISDVASITWKADGNKFVGKLDGVHDVSLEIGTSKSTLVVNNTFTTEFTEVGTASITLPKFIDHTQTVDPGKDPDEKPDPENPPVEDKDKLYDAQGNLNYALFAETIKDWMNDGYYTNKIMSSVSSVIYDIDQVSVDAQNKKINFGAYTAVVVTGTPMKTYQVFDFSSAELANKIINKELNNAEELTSYLKSLTGTPITLNSTASYELSSYDASEEDCETLYTMAENILTRLAEVGYQGNSINNAGTKVNDYAGATILSVRKDKDSGGNSMANMGTSYFSHIYITLQKDNEKPKILTCEVVYKTDGAAENIINNTKDAWMISSMSSKEIDYSKYSDSIATTQYAFVVQDETYLNK